MVGLPGLEPGSHDPQPCIIPIYDSPDLRFGLCSGFHALGANAGPGSVFQLGPLKIRVFSFFNGRVIMPTKKLSFPLHLGAFTAIFTYFSHTILILLNYYSN